MAHSFEAKTPAAVVRYEWVPDVGVSDIVLSASFVVVGGSAQIDEYGVRFGVPFFRLSGGADQETTKIEATALTQDSQTLSQIIYIPIRTSERLLTQTARDVCSFALRKIVGNGVAANATEMDDALERLNAMIAIWRIQEIDVGVVKELSADDTIAIPDAFITALKFCLRRDLHDFYGVPLSALDVQQARDAQAAVRAKTMSVENLSFDHGLTTRAGRWDFTRGY